ncbi:MAG: hypothetical protein HKN23_21940 [Verrucomicrobiales bacterium]|nr:hypothetical protein [Verrucomicrobiales bacterium]
MHPKPTVVTWFYVYNAFMILMAIATVLLGVFFFGNPPEAMLAELTEEDKMVFQIYGVLFPVCGAPMAIAHLIAFFIKPRPGSWVYNLILICLGLTGCPTIAASVPLLIFWLKPETKRYYGKEVPEDNLQPPVPGGSPPAL